MNPTELKSTLAAHAEWIADPTKGACAYIEGACLGGAHLEGANLKGAHLERAYLEGAHLEGAHLEGAYLKGAYLEGAHLEGANLKGAYLQRAHLEGAHLQRAYLQRAHLEGVTGNMRELKSLSIETYSIAYTKDTLQIGCESHALSDWWGFDSERIAAMDGRCALKFWKKYRDVLKTLIGTSHDNG